MMHSRLPKTLLLAFVLLLSLLLTACDDEMANLVIDMGVEWAQTKGLVSCKPAGDPNCQLSPNFITVGTYLAGYGADDNVQAAFDTYDTVNDINKADQLAQEGFANNDIQKLQEATTIRPNDWSYDQQISVLFLAQGNEQEASASELDAENKAQSHLDATIKEEGLSNSDPKAHAACVSTYSNLYQQRDDALVAQINKDPNADNADFLISQLDLVRSHMAELLDADSANDPCSTYGG